ncbi:uncharacterized protein [Eucyclogobius newberryi]|uniref:uncharacterized protein n=1 Tax=Eucyclogobius newberryi TaxID=166745 RepID=UPI003B5B6DA8
MFKIVLFSLVLSGLQALPISRTRGLTETHHALPAGTQDGKPVPLPDSFRQGTEPSGHFIMDLNTGQVQDYISKMDRRAGLRLSPLGNGHGEMDRRHWLKDITVEDAPVQKNGGGWVRVEGQSILPDGFRQGTEPSNRIPEGFRQGTEPSLRIPNGFRQGTERSNRIPEGFRQGTEPSLRIPNGFRQGTERSNRIPEGFRQGTEPSLGIPHGFRQGTEPSLRIPHGFRQGTEPSLRIPHGFRQGTGPTNLIVHRNGAVLKALPVENVNIIPIGFRQGTEPSNRIPEGFRQGTEHFMAIPAGFKQGTEPSLRIPHGFRQGTEPTNPIVHRNIALLKALPVEDINTIPVSFRQGTEPSYRIPEGFRQGTEPSLRIPHGFKQDTETSNLVDHKELSQYFNAFPAKQFKTIRDGFKPSNQILNGFRPGMGPFMPIRDGQGQDIKISQYISNSFRQENELFKSRQEPKTTQCKGELIYGRCYTFNPTPLPFLEAQDSCKRMGQNAELASVTSEDLHSRLISMVTSGGEKEGVMTWLGGMVKNHRASWLDSSEWRYSDWMPGQPNIHSDKPVCVEMFRMDETWWTAADCDLKRASICSYPVVA